MSLSFGQTEFLLRPSSLQRRAIPSRHHHRAWKRRRLKPLTVENHLNPTPPPFDNLFNGLLSQFPSVNTLYYIAPTLGFASGLALFFSSSSSKLPPNPRTIEYPSSDIGEWILFTSPTPFNRFVTLRCPSIYFAGNEFLENVSEKLVNEDRHYVKLNSGRMIQPVNTIDEVDEHMVYQRLCVGTEDGGVLSLDWPAYLDLEEEHGLDTTVLIVPGTVDGSNERKIKVFVCDCLRRGVFPVVMNPRGCAGSPLTTPRLFTAADSGDISTAIQYITKKRPWTTLMAVGWEYGANMLTKYLAEFGEKTPLTAATCIDNPFDLEEALRSSVYHTDFDQRHTDGLIKILQRNKELFQGRGKGFDVDKALSASSVRDFEEAISMVSYGFETIEDFYASSSTREVIGKVKVPVLFIQNDDEKVPLFSIPRSLIAENPYTSLLLCSYKPSSKIMDERLNFSWCQHLTLEWLTAVELGLLKGHHPLLKDIDVTVNPSNGLALVKSRASNRRGRVDRLLNITNGSSTNPRLEMFQENNKATSSQSRSTKDMGELLPTNKRLQQDDNNAGKQSDVTIDAIAEEEINSSDSERGQAQQTAEVVMNMLDITVPDAISDEQKKKVLNAVGQGETLIKALQDAVPEDVRGKLTTAVSGILQSRGSELRFDKLLSLGHIPKVASGSNSKVLGTTRPTKANRDEDVHSSDQKERINGPADSFSKADHSSDLTHGDMKIEKQSSEISEKQNDTGLYQSVSNDGGKRPEVEKVDLNNKGNSYENEQSSGGSDAQISDREIVSEINANQELSSMFDGPDGIEDVPNQNKVERGTGKGQSDPMEEKDKQTDDLSNDQDTKAKAYNPEDSSAPSLTAEAQVSGHEAESDQRKEEKGPVSVSNQNHSDPPSFSVSQALGALTGFDDTTQVAVNSVFHVIEGMIDQLEEGKGNINEMKNENSITEVNGMEEVKEFSESSESKNHLMQNDPESAGTIDPKTAAGAQSGNSDGTLLYDSEGSPYEYKQEHCAHGEYDSNSSGINSTGSQIGHGGEISSVPAAGELQTRNFVKHLNSSSEKVPGYITTFPYGDPLYKEYLKTYLSMNMKSAKPLDMDETSALYLDYIPEEGQWKLLEQTEDNIASVDECATRGGYREDSTDSQPRSKHRDNNIIEPSYVIVDDGKCQDQNEETEVDNVDDSVEFDETKSDESTLFIRSLILECLNVEVGRRANAADMEDLELKLAREIEFVANAVSLAAGQGKHHRPKGNDKILEKLSTVDGENIIRVISSAVQETQYLRTLLPIGVVVGSSLAALRKFYNVSAVDSDEEQDLALDQVDKSSERLIQVGAKESSQKILRQRENKDNLTSYIDEDVDDTAVGISKNDGVMVGAVTAALGASALLAHRRNTETIGPSNEPLKEKNKSVESSKLDEMPEKTQNNIVTSLAEKAMSVASPVVPMKEDGGVDHERLVAMLAELGQKGGLLRLVGKLALLWGGIRGAMSLTDKLISFLHIAERPLFQRIIGFIFMVLLLWSPIILPLLPALMQSWATRNPFKIAEFASIVGLYVAVMIMITLWGKRIRKYDDPLLQYGLDLDSFAKLQSFLMGLVGGAILVILIHTVNSSLGCAHLCWPTTLSSLSLEPVALMKSYGWMLMLIVQGTATATSIAVVEELLFRAWLPQEIAADFGYHCGVYISGLLFALSQRSMWEIPGLWLLSLSLSGARQRSGGSLALPIGLRAGILASNFILRMGGFLTYQPNIPLWVTGGHPFQPFSGVVGLAFSLVLAVILYPRNPLHKERTTRVIQE